MSTSPLAAFYDRIVTDEIAPDPAQEAVAIRLDTLAKDLAAWRQARGWSLAGLVGARGKITPPNGLYIHGRVGRGKSMLMDLFFAAVDFAPKRRVHFHEFMAEMQDRLNVARKTVEGDPIPSIAATVAKSCGLLCFDEFHVTDIADAMILGRLFQGLFERQVVVVATSNVAPRELYKGGLNRQLFLPTIALLEVHMNVVELEAAKDFRLDKLAGQPLYFTPLDETSRHALDAAFTRLTGLQRGQALDLDVKGRALRVPEAARGVARFTFADLCVSPLGPLDYLHIAHAFHTVIVEGIPQLGPNLRNEARRLINLVDTLYDQRVSLIVSAAVEPDAIYPAGDAAFLFERTASRLIEMRSAAYLAARADRATAARATIAEVVDGGA